MDDLERAVLCELDPLASDELRNSARTYLEKIKQNPDVWKFCFQRLFQPSDPRVQFWCLQILSSLFKEPEFYKKISNLQQKEVQRAIMNYYANVCKENPKVFLKNKLCEVLVYYFRFQYSEKMWPNFFKDIFSTLNSGVVYVEMFLRILNTIDELIVVPDISTLNKKERNRNTLVKDIMRDDAVPTIIEFFYSVLTGNNESLIKMALGCLKNYIDWIDIQFVTTEKFATLFYKYVKMEYFKIEAIECIEMIVLKGMDLVEKLKLIQSLHILDVICNIKFEDSGDDFEVNASALSCSVARQLRESWIGLAKSDPIYSQESYKLIESFLPFIFQIFSKTPKVSAEVIPFLTDYVNSLNDQLNQTETKQLGLILNIIHQKAKYPKDFNFNGLEQTEYENLIISYRRDLFALFKTIARKNKLFTLGFMKSVITNLFKNLKNLPYDEIEIALSLFYFLGEVIPEDTSKDSFFIETVDAIITNNISYHEHQTIQILYFEIINRYSKLLTSHEKVIPFVLESFIDKRGLRNPNPAVQSRTSFLFKKFVSSLKYYLHTYIEKLYEFSKDFMIFKLPGTTNEDEDMIDDKMFIYEAFGLILGSDKMDPNLRITIIKKILQPLISHIDEIITKKLYLQDTKEKQIFSILLSQEIGAIGFISKGFYGYNQTKETVELFQSLFNIVINVFKSLPKNTMIREKTIFVIQRMIQILGEHVIPMFKNVISELFSLANEPNELTNVLVLLNHLLSKTQKKSYDLIEDIFLPIIQKVFKLISNGNYNQNSQSEIDREQSILHKHYFMFIQSICNNKLLPVFTSQKNSANLNQILETILQGCQHQSIHVIKLSISILTSMIQNWCGIGTKDNLKGFDTFVYERIIPVIFSISSLEQIDFDDASTVLLIKDLSKLLRITYLQLGGDFLVFLRNQILSKLKLNDQEIQNFLVLIQNDNNKAFDNAFLNLMKNLNKS
eukprot:gene6828-10993_t